MVWFPNKNYSYDGQEQSHMMKQLKKNNHFNLFDEKDSNFHLYKSKLAHFGYKKIELPFANDTAIYSIISLVNLNRDLALDDEKFFT